MEKSESWGGYNKLQDLPGKKSTISMLDSRSNNYFRGLEKDHIIPKAFSGSSVSLRRMFEDLDNLQLVHKDCHKLKNILLDKSLKAIKKLNKELVGEHKNRKEVITVNDELATFLVIILADKGK